MSSASGRVRAVLPWALIVVAVAGSTSCGGRDLGKNLEMVFNPTKSYLLPGSGSNCLDLYNVTQTGGAVSTSVAELRLVYPQFSLSWASSELLYVAFINFTLRGSNFSGGVAEVKLTNTDIEPILGIGAGAPFNGALYPNFTGAPKTISTATQRTFVSPVTAGGTPTTMKFPPCSLMVGGISVTNPKQAFSGTVHVQLVGFSVAQDGSQTPVRKAADLQFEYVP